MRGINSGKIKGLIGILLIFMAISLIFYWENYGREQLLYHEVIVAKEDIYRNGKITKDNISILKLEETAIPSKAVLSLKDIIGKEVKQFIPQNAVIDYRYLADEGMTLAQNQFIFRIPNEWLQSCPGSLRRGDDIDLCAIQPIEEGDEEAAVDTMLPSIKLKVAYVKDSGNREVKNAENQKLERLDGTSNISSIEVIVKKDDVKKMQEIYDDGYKFLVLYR